MISAVQPPTETPSRVLIVKPSALGDVVTALPVLRGLRRTFGPDLHIAWMLSRSCAPAVGDDADLDEVVLFDRRRLGRMWCNPAATAAFFGFCRRLRRQRYDWVIDLQGLFRSGFFGRVTGAKIRAGFGSARELAPLSYNRILPTMREPTHTVDRNIALAKLLGVDARAEDFHLEPSPAGLEFAEKFAAEHGRDYIALAPATRWASKCWPGRYWRALAEALAKRTRVVVLAGPGEDAFTRPIADTPGVIDLAGRTSIPQMIALLARSRGLISPDSAPMNIASALGVPQVTIVGPTDPQRTGPYHSAAGVVQTHLPCARCLRRRCAHTACMQLIRPETVLAAAERVILG